MLPRRVSLAASFEAAGESNSSSRSPGKATGLLRLWIDAGAACIFQNIVFESSCVTSLVVVFRLPEKDKHRKEHDRCCQQIGTRYKSVPVTPKALNDTN